MIFLPIHYAKRHRGKAFTLAEVTLAMGIAAFCFIGIFGLLPIGLNNNQNSSEQTAAASLVRTIVADLRATPNTSSASPQYSIAFPSNSAAVYFSEDGTKQATAATARYLATITIDLASPTAFVDIKVTWPATAPVNAVAGYYEITTAIDRR
ncbi:MAG: Verru_Chthon cassette protein B [Verrucomicrobia bacterium]|nr:Verru_Chthon cassette protein B [Verrucomicrobiota bacterium]